LFHILDKARAFARVKVPQLDHFLPPVFHSSSATKSS
jgi:hypothetical protein